MGSWPFSLATPSHLGRATHLDRRFCTPAWGEQRRGPEQDLACRFVDSFRGGQRGIGRYANQAPITLAGSTPVNR